MDRYIDFLDRQKYKLIILTTLLVAVLSISLKDIAYEGNYRIWFDKDSKIIKDYDNFRNTFSGDDTFIVSFKDEKGIFREKPLKTVLSLTEKFKKIGGVQKVDSLTNYQYISSDEDELNVEDFIYDFQDLQKKKAIALQDSLIVNQLISKDGKTTLLAVRLSAKTGSNEDVNIKVMKELETILNEEKKRSGYEFFISGAPAITASLVTISQGDAIVLMPLAVISVIVLLFVFFRSIVGILIPSVVIVFTFLTTLSIQILLGYKLNNFTVNIPSFVVAIAIADSMHLYIAWIYYKLKGIANKEAVRIALGTNFLPIGLTSLTTAVGFASLGISKIEPISTLGIAITCGAIIAFILTITVAPAILLLLKDDYQVRPIRLLNLLNTKGYGAFIRKNDKKIVMIFSLFLIVVGLGLYSLKVDSNSIKYFGKNTTVRQGSDFVEKNLTGSMIYEIILDSGKKEGVKSPEFLEKISQFERELKTRYSRITFTTSLKDIIKRLDKTLNNKEIGEIPKDGNRIAQYLLLYTMSLPQGMEINDKIDTNERFLRLSINSKIVETSKDLEMIEWIKNWWKNSTAYTADVQGQTSIFAYMQSSVTDTLIVSVSVTLGIVALLMFLIFRDLKTLFLFILPNIAPIVLVGGVMGYLGIDIDIGVAVSVAVILGIAVDDTIHFFSKYFDKIRTMSFEDTVDYIISHSGNAMILTTFILSITFGVFGVSRFVPNVNFSIVTVTALNIALLLDLVLLPALLSLIHKKKA